jgi:hypothetical protein
MSFAISAAFGKLDACRAGARWGDLMIGLLLRVRDTPRPAEIERRARSAPPPAAA